MQCLIDTGCLLFAKFSLNLEIKNNILRCKIPKRGFHLAENDGIKRTINQITCAEFDIDGRREKIFGRVIPDLAYDIILGKPWMELNDVVYHSRKRCIQFGTKEKGLIVREVG